MEKVLARQRGRSKGRAAAAIAWAEADKFPLFSTIRQKVAGKKPISRQYTESH
jgi:hypothetical protein